MVDKNRIKTISYFLLAFALLSPLLMLPLPVNKVSNFYWETFHFVSLPAAGMSGLLALMALDKLTFFIGLLMFLTIFLIGLLNELMTVAFDLPPVAPGNITTALAHLGQIICIASLWYIAVGAVIIVWNRFYRKDKSIL